MSHPDSAASAWLQSSLSSLLASPYIHFNQPKVPGMHFRMGPGPIDLFSTRFSNLFTDDATGVVGGKEVDKQGLKDSLIALQRKWDSATAKVIDPESQGEEQQVS